MTDNFKNLLLDQTKIETLVNQFCEERNYNLISFSNDEKRFRVVFLRSEAEKPATVDLLRLKNGTVTVHYKTGKNPEAGLELASFLKESIDQDNQENVSLLLKDIEADKFEYLKYFLADLKDESAQNEFKLTEEPGDTVREKFKIRSVQYQDTLSLIHYKTKNKLHIQGKPLYSYRRVIYILADDLDLNGLLSVIHKKDTIEQSVQINYNDIEADLVKIMPNTYSRLESKIQKMLLSCIGVQNLNIDLPDYAMMVFPAFKVLEATIRKLFVSKGMYPEQQKPHGIGTWFDKPNFKFVLKASAKRQINCSNTEAALESCYNYYNKHRHRLFHTSDFADSSRIIEDKLTASKFIEKSLKLVDNAYATVSL